MSLAPDTELAMPSAPVAVVAIGRNEGRRLHTCIASAFAGGNVAVVVYVDSGSTDGSSDYARAHGCEVVNLDMNRPFTAARARNEGFARAVQCVPGLVYVQFVDGDCEITPGWITKAQDFLEGHANYAVVCGRRRERFPRHSVYNRLCDIEWNTPIGDTKSCGGDALMRVEALMAVNGYLGSLIAGEEPELCVRLRQIGWRIFRLDHDMTLHDAAMLRFGQWWKRAKRGGHAFAEGAWLHGAPPERHWVAETRRSLFWGLALPLAAVVLALGWHPALLSLFMAYPLQVLRLMRQPGGVTRASFLVLGKFPEAAGVLSFYWHRLHGRAGRIIEYK